MPNSANRSAAAVLSVRARGPENSPTITYIAAFESCTR